MNWFYLFFTKNNYKIRVLQLFFFILSLFGIFRAPLLWVLFGFVAYVFLETFAGNIALHRYFGHKSFKTSKRWHSFLAFLGHYIGVGSIISWVGQHRYHHLHSDTALDVHCPKNTGVFNILFGIWKVKIESSMVRDVLRDPILVFWHRNYWKLHISLLFLFFTLDRLFESWMLFSLYALPNLMCLVSGYILAIVPHLRGYKKYSINDESRNCWITNIYTLGEGWHNNHHANPQRLRQGEEWWEWDLPASVVEKLIQTEYSSDTFVQKIRV